MRRPSQGEAVAVWGLLAADVLAVLVTYSVVHPTELYSVSRDGIAGGLSRALVQLNFPVALVAIPLTLLALGALSRRAWLVGAPAIALCAFVAVPGVLDDEDLDARPVNAAAAIGAALALALTIAATRRTGTRFAHRTGGDRWRIAAATVAVVVSLPWVTAELGFHLPGGIFLTDDLYAEPGRTATAAVHLGHHHGFAGTLFVLSALLLSRTGPPGLGMRRAYAALVALALVYGTTNLAQDLWHEQVVKRGWASWDVPSALFPAPSLMWVLMLSATAVVYMFGFARPRSPSQG
ncbi:MAG: hypothetical protein R6W48_06620 [Gaiellaceae bacterium]